MAQRVDRLEPRRALGVGLAITNEIARRVGWTVTYGPGELAVHLRGTRVNSDSGG